MRKLKSKLLPHATHSLALAPVDYHMFGPLTTTCVDDDLQVMIKDVLHTWLVSQLKASLAHGIRRLVKRYTKCVENRGD
jgi:hypothetical protein